MEVVPVLFNKDTFFSDIKVSSIYLHDTRACEQDRIKEGESEWVLQGVVSKACFRRQRRSGQKHLHGNVCAHQQQLCQKAWTWEEASPHYPRRDGGRALVAGDFNGAAWRRSNGNSRQPTCIIEEAFADTVFPLPPGPTPWWRQCLVNGPMCVVLSNPRTRMTNGRFVCTEPSQLPARPWASVQEIKVAHHEVWLHLHLVGNQHAYASRGNQVQRVLLKERSCPYPPNKEKGRYDDESDRSLSSLSSVRGLVPPQAAGMTCQGTPNREQMRPKQARRVLSFS